MGRWRARRRRADRKNSNHQHAARDARSQCQSFPHRLGFADMAINDVEAFCRALWRHEDKTVAALAARVDPNAADCWGHTPLLMAAQHGDLSLISFLVRR